MTSAVIAIGILLVVILLGVPIAFAMGVIGVVGLTTLIGLKPALAMLAQVAQESGMSYSLSVVPLFILMGNLVTRAGISDDLYSASNAWLGHRRGGLAMATVVACGGFSAMCGSSLATAATMAKVSMPSMRRYGYDPALAAGSIAAGGTLGILIPPSVILIIYGLITNQDIGYLFAAGMLPGMVGIVGYVAAVALTTWARPELGPPGERLRLADRFRALGGVWRVLALFALVIGGIYAGIFTPTEAAGIGATGALAFALARRSLTWRSFLGVLIDSAKTTTMIFMILIGALLFSNFVNLAGLPDAMSGWVQGLNIAPLGVIAVILALYLVLGCVLESMSMVLLTVPLFYPLVQALGFDLIWFGIVVVVVTEISLITPPVGLNVFVLRATLPEVSTGTIFRGIVPFLAADVVRLAVIVLVPALSLILPRLLGYAGP